MEYQDWKSRWDEGKIGFHLGRPHPALMRHRSLFAGVCSVLVPLAGKTADLDLLAEDLPEVLANEFVESAARDYFAERHQVPTESRHGEALALGHGRVRYLVQDFFSLSHPPVDAIFDRAAMVAVQPEVRVAYVAKLASLLKPGGVLLLVTFEYDQDRIAGPPFSISEGEVHALLDPEFEVSLLDTSEESVGDRMRNAGVSSLREHCFRAIRKPR